MRLITFIDVAWPWPQCGGEVEQVDVAALQVGTRDGRRERAVTQGDEVVTPSKVKNHTERQLMLLPFRKRVVLLQSSATQRNNPTLTF